MYKRLSQILGAITAILVVAGLLMERGHFLALMNVNIALDLLRIPLAAALLYAGFGNASTGIARNTFGAVGIIYFIIGLLGLIDSTMWGLLPDGLTGFDQFFHLFVGLFAIWMAYIAPAREAVRKA